MSVIDSPCLMGEANGFGCSAPSSAHDLPWRRIVQVSGIPTEILGLSAIRGPSKLQVLLVPGNPGSAQYYTLHMQMLHAALHGQADVWSVTHAGHDPLLPGEKLWSLQDQIRHKADFMRQFMLLPGRPPLVLAAHSIGAYVALLAVQDVELDREYLMPAEAQRPPILKVIAMFPFFSIDRSPSLRIRLLSLAARRYEVMGRAAQVLRWLPAWLRRAVVHYSTRGEMDGTAEEVTQKLLARGSVRNNFFMARSEFQDLDGPPPWELLRSMAPRLHVLGCPEDIWLSKPQFCELLANVPGLQVTWLESVRHAYCTSRLQCELVTAVVADLLASLFVTATGPACRASLWSPDSLPKGGPLPLPQGTSGYLRVQASWLTVASSADRPCQSVHNPPVDLAAPPTGLVSIRASPVASTGTTGPADLGEVVLRSPEVDLDSSLVATKASVLLVSGFGPQGLRTPRSKL